MATLTREQIVTLTQASMRAAESGRIDAPPLKDKYVNRLRELQRTHREGESETMGFRGAGTTKKHYPKGLDKRMRDGEIRKKRSDTLVRTLREEYGPNFAKGHRANAKLGAVLKKEGLETLDQLLKKGRPSK